MLMISCRPERENGYLCVSTLVWYSMSNPSRSSQRIIGSSYTNGALALRLADPQHGTGRSKDTLTAAVCSVELDAYSDFPPQWLYACAVLIGVCTKIGAVSSGSPRTTKGTLAA